MKKKTYQAGMTLVEIMIALLIGAFLLGGVLQIFANSKKTYRMLEELSRLQENGRFGMDFLSRDIRMAGFWGCMIPADEDIAGTEGSSGAPDSIVIRAAFVRTPTNACGTNVTKAATVACPQTSDPTNIYADNTSIITYSINSNALRRSTNCVSSANADIVEGIENMQILYGEDTDPTPDYTANYYVSADNVTDMSKVVSVRITLTARSINGNLTSIGDGRLRRDFTTTIAIRNRLP